MKVSFTIDTCVNQNTCSTLENKKLIQEMQCHMILSNTQNLLTIKHEIHIYFFNMQDIHRIRLRLTFSQEINNQQSK